MVGQGLVCGKSQREKGTVLVQSCKKDLVSYERQLWILKWFAVKSSMRSLSVILSSMSPQMTYGSSIGLYYVLLLWKLVKHMNFIPTWSGTEPRKPSVGAEKT